MKRWAAPVLLVLMLGALPAEAREPLSVRFSRPGSVDLTLRTAMVLDTETMRITTGHLFAAMLVLSLNTSGNPTEAVAGRHEGSAFVGDGIRPANSVRLRPLVPVGSHSINSQLAAGPCPPPDADGPFSANPVLPPETLTDIELFHVQRGTGTGCVIGDYGGTDPVDMITQAALVVPG